MAFKKKSDIKYFDYKDFKTLQRYISPYGQIETCKKTGLSAKQQRQAEEGAAQVAFMGEGWHDRSPLALVV